MSWLETRAPAQAMRQWMDLFADWLATKRGMLALLATGPSAIGHEPRRSEIIVAITTILSAGVAAGDIRSDIDPEDAASLVGIFTVAGAPTQHVRAARLLDLLMDGLKPPHR